jgi:hypothetical protein
VSNQLTNQSSNPADGFEGYEGASEGGAPQQSGGVIQGDILKFTNESEWVTRDGEALPGDRELIVADVGRVAQKWIDQKPVETRVLGPGEKFPDIEKLNADSPRSEWTEDKNGKPRGPWQRRHLVYLFDPEFLDRFTFTTGTVGGAIAVREIVEKTRMARRIHGNVHPIVKLTDVFMNTKYGGRQRPHFEIVRWADLSGGGEATALPAPEAAQLVESKPAAEKPAPWEAENPAATDTAAARERLAKYRTTKRGK